MKYDFVFLLQSDEELKNLRDLVKSSHGQIIKEDAWGQKNLAYPVKKLTVANYYNWQLELGKTEVSEFKKKLNFNDNMLRYLLLKAE